MCELIFSSGNSTNIATKSSTGKVQGTFKLSNLTINSTDLSNTALQTILDSKGMEYKMLKDNLETNLLDFFLAENDVVVVSINITNLSVGSLIVDYVVTLDATKSNFSKVEDINPIKNFTQFFGSNSTFTGYTSPTFSMISGILYFYYFYFPIQINAKER